MESSDEDNSKRSPVHPASSPFGHLLLTPGGPRQSEEWARRERDRRAGRHRKEWWKQKPATAPRIRAVGVTWCGGHVRNPRALICKPREASSPSYEQTARRGSSFA